MPTYLYCYLRMRNKGCVRAAFTKSHNPQIVEMGLQTKILIIMNDFCLVDESLFLKNWYTNFD